MGSHAHNCKMVKAKSPAPTTTLLHESTETSSYVSSQKAKGSVQTYFAGSAKTLLHLQIAGLQGNLAAMFFEKAPGDDASTQSDHGRRTT